jgi:CheY-like chemotaxis protein
VSDETKHGGLLLVEDNEADILFFRRALKKVRPDAPLEVATSGTAAVQHLTEARPAPSVMLLDLKLPRMSGLEVLEWMKARPELRQVRTVVLTSSSEDRDVRRSYELGAVAYVVKPVDVGGLSEVVAAIVKIHENPGESAAALLGRHSWTVPVPR